MTEAIDPIRASDRRIRPLAADDARALLPAMARAFAPQPFTQWLVGAGDDALERGVRLLAVDFEMALPYELSLTTEGVHGGAFWLPPERHFTPIQLMLTFARIVQILGIDRTTPARLRGLRRAERAAPTRPYYYLSVLAVAPRFQGQGIGSALLAPMLERCDAERMPAYLETDTEINVQFYRKHGFDVRDVLHIADPDVRLWTMWRPPYPA